jgi:hypothetical protein
VEKLANMSDKLTRTADAIKTIKSEINQPTSTTNTGDKARANVSMTSTTNTGDNARANVSMTLQQSQDVIISTLNNINTSIQGLRSDLKNGVSINMDGAKLAEIVVRGSRYAG